MGVGVGTRPVEVRDVRYLRCAKQSSRELELGQSPQTHILPLANLPWERSTEGNADPEAHLLDLLCTLRGNVTWQSSARRELEEGKQIREKRSHLPQGSGAALSFTAAFSLIYVPFPYIT